jgi:hypothetical protein
VINFASSEFKNSAAWAMSHPVPIFAPKGTAACGGWCVKESRVAVVPSLCVLVGAIFLSGKRSGPMAQHGNPGITYVFERHSFNRSSTRRRRLDRVGHK